MHPNHDLLKHYPNVCGFSAEPDFLPLLNLAAKLFPNNKTVSCVMDNSYLHQQSKLDFERDWKRFIRTHPDYELELHDIEDDRNNNTVRQLCYSRNATGKVVIIPKWSPFMSFLGKNSKAPFLAVEQTAFTQGTFAVLDVDPLEITGQVAMMASNILSGKVQVDTLTLSKVAPQLLFDYKQLEFFHIDSTQVASLGTVLNRPFWDQYGKTIVFIAIVFFILLIVVILWLIRQTLHDRKERELASTRMLIQQSLIAQRDEFYNILHSMRDYLITYDLSPNIHFVNHSFRELLREELSELELSQLEGSKAGSFLHLYNNEKDILLELIQQIMDTGKQIPLPQGSFIMLAHTNQYFPVSGEAVPIFSQKKLIGISLSFHNISEEEVNKRFFDLAVNKSTVCPWRYNVKKREFTFPEGFLSRFGYPKSVTVVGGMRIRDSIHPDDLPGAWNQFKSLRSTGEFRVKCRVSHFSGEYEWFDIRSSYMEGIKQGIPYNIVGICQSIQSYKDTEEELIEARDAALKADRLKSAFLANISHEIRTPLNSIVGFSDLLKDEEMFSPEERREFIDTIGLNSALLLSLINDILDLARIESGTMDYRLMEYSLKELLTQVYNSHKMIMPEDVKLYLNLPEQDCEVTTDKVRLLQVISNFINNAKKFTSQGRITIGYVAVDQDWVEIYVEDTGVGISPENIKRIFDRFYKVNSFTQGTGLGLSICETIAENLRGKLDVTSEEGKGSRFSILLPI